MVYSQLAVAGTSAKIVKVFVCFKRDAAAEAFKRRIKRRLSVCGLRDHQSRRKREKEKFKIRMRLRERERESN